MLNKNYRFKKCLLNLRSLKMVASQNGNGMIRLETSTSSFNFFRFDHLNLKSVNHSLILNVEIFLEFFNFNLLKSKQNKSLIDS